MVEEIIHVYSLMKMNIYSDVYIPKFIKDSAYRQLQQQKKIFFCSAWVPRKLINLIRALYNDASFQVRHEQVFDRGAFCPHFTSILY